MQVMNLQEIKSRLNIEKVIALQEEGFKLYSEGKVTVPPVGYMNLGQDFGEVHVKYGCIRGDEVFVVKIAGSYHQNATKVQGIIIAFDAKTGQPKAILQDEGYLTNLRTAIAGFITAKYLAPKKIEAIGMLGTGVQARFQAKLLKYHTHCRKLLIWGRNNTRVKEYIEEMTHDGFRVLEAKSPVEICQQCNLIVTTTSAQEPLIFAKDLQPGTHITAVGADAPGKQELDPKIFQLADLCVVDSKAQCLDHGEVFHPYKQGLLGEKDLVELGQVIANPSFQRQSADQITIADLTGVAVQDIQIAKSIL